MRLERPQHCGLKAAYMRLHHLAMPTHLDIYLLLVLVLVLVWSCWRVTMRCCLVCVTMRCCLVCGHRTAECSPVFSNAMCDRSSLATNSMWDRSSLASSDAIGHRSWVTLATLVHHLHPAACGAPIRNRPPNPSMCACVRVCVRACVCACVCVCVRACVVGRERERERGNAGSRQYTRHAVKHPHGIRNARHVTATNPHHYVKK